MVTSVIQPSFASGEVSKTLFGRVDLAKYRSGVELGFNMFVDYRGGLSNRAGTKYILQAYKSTAAVRLIEFKFGNNQNYMLEFGDFYMRIIQYGEMLNEAAKVVTGVAGNPVTITSVAHGYSNGDWVYFENILGAAGLVLNGHTFIVTNVTANTFRLTDLRGNVIGSAGVYVGAGTVSRIYVVPTPWAGADLALLKYTQVYDVMTFVHPSYKPRTLSRLAALNWQIAEVEIGTTAVPPNPITVATSGAGTVYYSYVVTSINAAGEESQASDPVQVASVNIATANGTITIGWPTVAGAIAYNVYKAQISTNGEVPIGSQHGFIGTSYGRQFKDPNIIPDFTTTPPLNDDPFAENEITSLTVTNGGSGYSLNPTVVINDPTGTGADFVAIVVSGIIQGFIQISGGKNYTAPVVVITDSTGTLATATAVRGPATGTWPSVTNIFQQRQIYAASNNQPQTLWASRPAKYTNFDVSSPVVDNDAYNFTLASKELNTIKSVVAMPGGLVILTFGGAWQLSGEAQGGPVTPTKVEATPQAYNGCNDIPPLVINYEILYVQAQGGVVRNLSYSFAVNIYTGTDLTVLSNHLFSNHTLLEWTYAEEPFKTVQAIRDDGILLTLTFLKEQEVYGWTHSQTLGYFESINSIREFDENGIYVVVRRLIEGAYWKYIERFASRQLPNGAESAWFLDAALEYPLTYQNGILFMNSASGVVTFTCGSGPFIQAQVGDVVRASGGRATIAAVLSDFIVNAVWTINPTALTLTGLPVPASTGTWSMTRPVSEIRGLEHLENETVGLIVDGVARDTTTVVDGAILIDPPGTRIIVGLPYYSDFKTLQLDTGDPTIQSKLKRLPGTSIRVNDTKGGTYGFNFEEMYDLKYQDEMQDMQSPALISGDCTVRLPGLWDVHGQICVRQTLPLPLTILATIPELVTGDDNVP